MVLIVNYLESPSASPTCLGRDGHAVSVGFPVIALRHVVFCWPPPDKARKRREIRWVREELTRSGRLRLLAWYLIQTATPTMPLSPGPDRPAGRPVRRPGSRWVSRVPLPGSSAGGRTEGGRPTPGTGAKSAASAASASAAARTGRGGPRGSG